jgi:hypothetical protein
MKLPAASCGELHLCFTKPGLTPKSYALGDEIHSSRNIKYIASYGGNI